MNDKSLYTQILGITAPWEVSKVELNLPTSEVKITIDYTKEKGNCPECNKELPIYDYRAERSWRYLDTCQMITTLSSRVPRINCSKHGVKTVTIPWSEANQRLERQK